MSYSYHTAGNFTRGKILPFSPVVLSDVNNFIGGIFFPLMKAVSAKRIRLSHDSTKVSPRRSELTIRR